MKIAIITDSGSGLVSYGDVYVLPLQILVNEKTYLDGVDLTNHQFYDLLETGIVSKTSLPTPKMIEDTIIDLQAKGYEAVIAIPLSSGLSSTMQTICMVCHEYQIPVYPVECFSTCNIQKYLVQIAHEYVHQGLNPNEIVEILNQKIEHSASLIFPTDLEYLKRGGRLTPLASSLAGLLKIKPLLVLGPNTDGKIDVKSKVRTEKKVAKLVLDELENKLKDGREYKVFVIHARKDEEATLFCDYLKKRLKDVVCEVSMDEIGAVITSHTGLGCIACQFIEK